MKRRFFIIGIVLVSSLLTVHLTGCGGGGGGGGGGGNSGGGSSVTLVSIVITPANPNIRIGAEQQFTATGIFSDHSASDITTQVTWSSSNPAIAKVTSSGLATGVASGTATIMATSGAHEIISGSATLTVTAVSS